MSGGEGSERYKGRKALHMRQAGGRRKRVGVELSPAGEIISSEELFRVHVRKGRLPNKIPVGIREKRQRAIDIGTTARGKDTEAR